MATLFRDSFQINDTRTYKDLAVLRHDNQDTRTYKDLAVLRHANQVSGPEFRLCSKLVQSRTNR